MSAFPSLNPANSQTTASLVQGETLTRLAIARACIGDMGTNPVIARYPCLPLSSIFPPSAMPVSVLPILPVSPTAPQLRRLDRVGGGGGHPLDFRRQGLGFREGLGLRA